MQRQQVGRDGDQPTGIVMGRDDRRQITDTTRRARVLDEHPVHVVEIDIGVVEVRDHQLDAQGFGPGGHDGDGLGQGVGVDEKATPGVLLDPMQQGHGLGGGGGLVEQRCVGDLASGQIRHHGLEVQQHLEATLGYLGLVRRVGRVPGGVLQDGARHDGGGDGAVVAEADHRGPDLVGVRHRPQGRHGLDL